MKNNPKSNMIKIFIIGAVVIVILALAVIISPPGESKRKILLDTSTGMTLKKRIKDFESLCDFLENNVPFINEYDELYDLGFDEITDYYAELVKNTNNDFEYYSCIEGFLNNIPSGHMSLGYPNVNYIAELYKFRTNDYPEFGTACQYWEGLLEKESQKYCNNDVSFEVYLYADGEYLQSEYYAHINGCKYDDSKLISVNGVPVDEFIKLCPLEYKLMFDHINSKSYRPIITFNNTCGNECTAEFELSNGKQVTKKLYYGTSGMSALKYLDYFQSGEENSENNYPEPTKNDTDYSSKEIINSNIYAYNNTEDNFIYVMFNDFIGGGAEFSNLLDNAEIPQNVIVDLRYNTGGYDDISIGILQRLINHTIEYSTEVYTPIDYGNFEKKNINGKNLYVDTRHEVVSGISKQDYSIYVLVSSETLSAADNFSAFIKNNNLGVIIGDNNTYGEAYGSPDLKVLETSGLYFYYTDRKWNNVDGTDNSVYGTAPDIYVPFDGEAMKMRDVLMLNNEMVFTYENRLKWDNVLIKTLEIIKEDENDQTNNSPVE